MLLADSDSEGEYLQFGNDDRSSNDHAFPGTSLLCNGAAGHGESVHKAPSSDHFGPLPNRDGGAGVDVVFVSIGEADDRTILRLFFLIVCAQMAAGRQYRCSQFWVTLGLCVVPCNKTYHTLKNYKRSPRYLIGQIAVTDQPGSTTNLSQRSLSPEF